VDKEGCAIRDPDSTTYVAAIETAGEFGPRIYPEAWNRGWERAGKKVVIGDGAEWIWNIADEHFPDRRSLSRTPAPLGRSPQTIREPGVCTETLDDVSPGGTAG
jgi:hypothetical protein